MIRRGEWSAVGESRFAVGGVAMRTALMDRRKDSPQVQRLEVVELGRRRRWTEGAKRRIVEESFVGRRQASATARRYGISTSLLFSWRKAYREGTLSG